MPWEYTTTERINAHATTSALIYKSMQTSDAFSSGEPNKPAVFRR
jgi:hypothetical protein